VRHEDEFETLNLLSASSRVPLITLWSATWCPSCKIVSPLIQELIESGVGEAQGTVSFAEIQLDSPTLGDLGMRYQVSSTKLTELQQESNRLNDDIDQLNAYFAIF
jgi:thiol-disulfide isomerase/thioredoxin